MLTPLRSWPTVHRRMHGTIVGIHSLMFYFYFAASNAQLSTNICYYNDTNKHQLLRIQTKSTEILYMQLKKSVR